MTFEIGKPYRPKTVYVRSHYRSQPRKSALNPVVFKALIECEILKRIQVGKSYRPKTVYVRPHYRSQPRGVRLAPIGYGWF